MQEFVNVTGMILKTEPIGDYDRRVVILTRERGKISAFAKGARRPNSRLLAATNPFSFGQFKLFEGKTSYNIMEANISNYFEELREDYIAAYYGVYFMEIADYYSRENNDEVEMLKLLFQSMRALIHKNLNNELVRCIFEMRSLVVNGEYPGVPEKGNLQDSTLYAFDYIGRSSIEKLFSFTVTDSVLEEMKTVAASYCKRFMDKKFKSLEIIETLC